MSVTDSNIPQEMKDLPRWILWKLIFVPGRPKPTKVPYSVDGKKADTTDSTTWSTYEECLEKQAAYDGLGFVFDPSDNIFGIDYDSVRDDETGEIDPTILEEVRALSSYTEASPSGTGLHVILRGTKPGKECRAGCREMYETGRYFTVTGNHLAGTPKAITSPPVDKIKAVHDKIVSEQATPKKNKAPAEVAPGTETKSSKTRYTDEEIIAFAMAAKNADKFERLFDGDKSEYTNEDGEEDDSSADLALCSLIAFYTQDRKQINRIFKRSTLYREKWNREDYREATITRALNTLTASYEPETKPKTTDEDDGIEIATLEEIHQLRDQEKDRRMNTEKMLSLDESHIVNKVVRYISSLSDTYVEYQISGALWLLSALAGDKLVMRLKQQTLQTNLWIFVLGLSSISRKTTTMDKISQMYEVVTGEDVYNDDYSAEGYLEILQENPRSNFIRDEAASLLAKYNRKHNDGIYSMECSIYDGKSTRKTLSSGRDKKPKVVSVKDPCVTHFYATTPDKLVSTLDYDGVTSGYAPRFMFAYPRYARERKPLEFESSEDIDAWGELMVSIKQLHALCTSLKETPITAAPGVMEYYNEVMFKLEDEIAEMDNDILSTAFQRAQVHVLKIAMLLEFGKSAPSYVIQMDTMKASIELVIEYFLPTYMDIVDRLQEDIKTNQIEKVIHTIRRLGGAVDHSTALHNSKLKSRDFMECIRTLQESETIQCKKEENSKKIFYILTTTQAPKFTKFTKFTGFTHSPSLKKRGENGEFDSSSHREDEKQTQERGILMQYGSESVNAVNLVNEVNFSENSSTQPVDNPRAPIPANIETFCTNWQETTGEKIFKKTAKRAYQEIIKANRLHESEHSFFDGAIKKLSQSRCIDCGNDEAPNTTDGEGRRCDECHRRYSSPPPVVIPEEIDIS